MREPIKIWPVFLLGYSEIKTMKSRVINKVALYPPHFVVHLIPLGARINSYFHFVELQHALARLNRRGSRGDEPARSLLIKHFLAVRR